MGELERAGSQLAGGVSYALRRVASWAFGLLVVAAVAAVATYVTGWWAFPRGDRRTAWSLVGAVLCAVPPAAAAMAWLILRRAARHTPDLIVDVRALARGAVGRSLALAKVPALLAATVAGTVIVGVIGTLLLIGRLLR